MAPTFSADLVALVPRMTNWARLLTRHRQNADDLVQEALVRAWANRAQFSPGTNLPTGLGFSDRLRQFLSGKRRSWREVELEPFHERTLTCKADQDAILSLDELRLAMSLLSENRRAALLLVGVAGLSYGEAAAISHCATDTIKSRVGVARAQLHRILAAGDYPRDGARAHLASGAIGQSTLRVVQTLTECEESGLTGARLNEGASAPAQGAHGTR